MTTDALNDERRRHIDGFVDSFVDSTKRERYRSFISNPKKRSTFTDDLNHKVTGNLIAKYIVAKPPRYSSKTIAYLIADESEIDDRFVDAAQAINLIESAYFGAIASIIPGILIAFKEEAPSKLLWLYRPDPK
jgi:hypothetical protein